MKSEEVFLDPDGEVGEQEVEEGARVHSRLYLWP